MTCRCHLFSEVRESRKCYCEQLKADNQSRLRVCLRCGRVWETWEIDKKLLEKLLPKDPIPQI